MAVRIVRLGTERIPGEGVRIGTVRHPPRGIRKSEYAARNYFDVWMPTLAPSALLLKEALGARSPRDWKRFAGKYRREMGTPTARATLELLAALSQASNFSVGCYCEDESRCHRSLLGAMLAEHGAKIADQRGMASAPATSALDWTPDKASAASTAKR
jgi:uncharacterized protein YeaO (DUF488 family)